jgi:hypothetical protein
MAHSGCGTGYQSSSPAQEIRQRVPLYISGLGQSLVAYNRISEIEPEEQYYWGEVDVTYLEGHEFANVLIGKKPKKGSVDFEGSEWDGRNDPLFREALVSCNRNN